MNETEQKILTLFDDLKITGLKEYSIDEYREKYKLKSKEFCERFSISQSAFSDSRRKARFAADRVQTEGRKHRHITVNSCVILGE